MKLYFQLLTNEFAFHFCSTLISSDLALAGRDPSCWGLSLLPVSSDLPEPHLIQFEPVDDRSTETTARNAAYDGFLVLL